MNFPLLHTAGKWSRVTEVTIIQPSVFDSVAFRVWIYEAVYNCTWHEFVSTLREAAKNEQRIFGRRKNPDGHIKWITFMSIELDLKRRVISIWGTSFIGLNSIVVITWDIKLQEADHEVQHLSYGTELVTGWKFQKDTRA